MLKLVEEVENLTVKQMVVFTNVLQERLGISDAELGIGVPVGVPMAPAAAPAAGAGDGAAAEAPKEEEKTTFDVLIEAYEASAKIKIIKEVRAAVSGLGLKEGKELVRLTASGRLARHCLIRACIMLAFQLSRRIRSCSHSVGVQVEKLPATVKAGISKEDAAELEKKLTAGVPPCPPTAVYRLPHKLPRDVLTTLAVRREVDASTCGPEAFRQAAMLSRCSPRATCTCSGGNRQSYMIKLLPAAPLRGTGTSANLEYARNDACMLCRLPSSNMFSEACGSFEGSPAASCSKLMGNTVTNTGEDRVLLGCQSSGATVPLGTGHKQTARSCYRAHGRSLLLPCPVGCSSVKSSHRRCFCSSSSSSSSSVLLARTRAASASASASLCCRSCACMPAPSRQCGVPAIPDAACEHF